MPDKQVHWVMNHNIKIMQGAQQGKQSFYFNLSINMLCSPATIVKLKDLSCKAKRRK
jgi:hypothetical protein